jgi:hypothetical protein
MLELSKTPEMNIKQMSLNIMRDVAKSPSSRQNDAGGHSRKLLQSFGVFFSEQTACRGK